MLSQVSSYFTQGLGSWIGWASGQNTELHPMEIKIVEIPLEEPPKIDETRQREIQAALNQNGISLTCREFTPLAQPNHMQEGEIQKYIQSISQEYREAKSKLFQSVQKISYQDLEQALFACVQELNRTLNDHDYAIGFAENKSQKWIAELALQYMAKSPKESFSTYTATSLSGGGESAQSHLTGKSDAFVVFDDASYSGTQLCELLIKLVDELAKQPACPRNICLVVPFMSEPAQKKLKETWDSVCKKVYRTAFHIITSQIKVTAFADKYPPISAAREELFSCEKDMYEKGLEVYHPLDARAYRGYGGEDTKCLTYMEWKVPDDVSVPHSILFGGPHRNDAFRLLTEFPPPYKAKK